MEKCSSLKMTGEAKKNGGPAFRLAVVSLVLCGLVFPLVLTGLAQVLLPSQANGSLVDLKGKAVGSDLIAQSFNQPFFFHPRNNSASGVDPHITLEDALSQIPRIADATNLTSDAISRIVNQNVERTLWWFGDPYVNVLRLNLALIQDYESVYQRLDPSLFN